MGAENIFFSVTLYNFQKSGGGGGGREAEAPPAPLLPRALAEYPSVRAEIELPNSKRYPVLGKSP